MAFFPMKRRKNLFPTHVPREGTVAEELGFIKHDSLESLVAFPYQHPPTLIKCLFLGSKYNWKDINIEKKISFIIKCFPSSHTTSQVTFSCNFNTDDLASQWNQMQKASWLLTQWPCLCFHFSSGWGTQNSVKKARWTPEGQQALFSAVRLWQGLLTWFLSWGSSNILRLFMLELLSKMSIALSRSSWFFSRMESCDTGHKKRKSYKSL